MTFPTTFSWKKGFILWLKLSKSWFINQDPIDNESAILKWWLDAEQGTSHCIERWKPSPLPLHSLCLVTPCGVGDLGQHWLRWWLGAWRHQAIAWTNVNLSSVRSSDNHLKAISYETQPPITENYLSKIPSKYSRSQLIKYVTKPQSVDWKRWQELATIVGNPGKFELKLMKGIPMMIWLSWTEC